jgi:hypothetical protein
VLSKGALQQTNLVAQRQILEREFALRLPERPGGRKQVPEHVEHGRGRGPHRAEIF